MRAIPTVLLPHQQRHLPAEKRAQRLLVSLKRGPGPSLKNRIEQPLIAGAAHQPRLRDAALVRLYQ